MGGAILGCFACFQGGRYLYDMLTLECKHLKANLISVSISLPVASLRQGRNLFEEGEQECIITAS